MLGRETRAFVAVGGLERFVAGRRELRGERRAGSPGRRRRRGSWTETRVTASPRERPEGRAARSSRLRSGRGGRPSRPSRARASRRLQGQGRRARRPRARFRRPRASRRRECRFRGRERRGGRARGPSGSARPRARAALRAGRRAPRSRGGSRGSRRSSVGSTRTSGVSGATVTSIGWPASTSGSASRTARNRSAGGVGSGRGTYAPASRRAADRRLSIRRERRSVSEETASTSALSAADRRRRSRPRRIAVIGVLRSCETALRSDVLRASLSRRASRCVRSSRNFSRSTARATSRPTDASAWRSARVPRTRRTPLERPPSERGRYTSRAPTAAGTSAASPLLPTLSRSGSERSNRWSPVATTTSPRPESPGKRTRAPPRASIERSARPAASPRAPTRFVAAKRSTESS